MNNEVTTTAPKRMHGTKMCFAFIRYAINPTAYEPPVMSEEDWLYLLHFSVRQAIVGIVFEGVNRYDVPGSKPSEEMVDKWVCRMASIERKNQYTNKVTAQFFRLVEKDGFKCCILKGQGNNLLYPNPYSRTSGDIDLWMAQTGDPATDTRRILKYVRSHNPKGRSIYHHIDYGYFNKVDVEVHYRPSFLNNPVYNHRLQKWFTEQADTQFSNRVELPDKAGIIAIPTPEFNAVYQLVHIYQHLINRGMGLRHIIDYYYVLMALKDRENLNSTLRHLGLEKIAGAVMWALNKMLGMEEKYMIAPPNGSLGYVLAKEILNSGDFGKQSKGNSPANGKQKAAWRFALKKNIQRLNFDVRMMRHLPSECLCEPLFRIYHFFWRCVM
jgi:rubredoxin